MIIDSGPKLSIREIVPVIKQLPQIDLLVLTHYDEDHIMGFIEYFKQYPEDVLKIKEYWCNCASDIEVKQGAAITAYDNAKSFADCLRSIAKDHPDIRWIELIKAGHEYHNDLIDIEVIAPSKNALNLNREKYEKEQYSAISYHNMKDDLAIPMEELAKRETSKNNQVVNNSSIAFIQDAKGTGQWHSEGTSDILRAIKMVVDAFDIMV